MRRPGARPKRSPWRDYPGVFWMIAAVVVSIVHREVPQATWLMIHMVVLGALTHAIFVWSRYFTEALMKVPSSEQDKKAEVRRIILLQAGAVAVMVGYPLGVWPLVALGAAGVILSVTWHGLALDAMVRRSLGRRFAITVRYYLCAVGSLIVGAGLGAALALGLEGDWHGRLLLAHTMANLLGWVGVTVAGTLITFWPTLLRTRMDQRAERFARQALPLFVAGVTLLVAGGLLGWMWLGTAGLVAYGAGLLWWGRCLLRPLITKPPREFAGASVMMALPWFVVGIIWMGVVLVSGQGWAGVTASIIPIATVFVAGFAAQLLTGALSYLLPTALGGGPAAVRENIARFNRWGMARLVIINGALVLYLLPAPSWVLVTVSLVGLLALAAFIPIMIGAIVATVRQRRARSGSSGASDGPGASVGPAAGAATAGAATAGAATAGAATAGAATAGAATAAAVPAQTPSAEGKTPVGAGTGSSIMSGGQVVSGILALTLAVTVGIAADPVAAGFSPATATTSSEVTATGEEVRVQVRAVGMTFQPSSIDVQAGDHVILEVINDDPVMAHDLQIGDQATPRLVPGESAELDLGVVGESLHGWCTIAGHRQSGMTFDLNVAGGPEAAAPGAAEGADPHAAHGAASATSERVLAVADAELSTIVDPVLPPLPANEGPVTHQITIDMTEEPLEVAPGVWQTRWTYNGEHVGPTLRGRVGDRFEITLINSGTMGHSIDFHASWLAPDEPMRTIQPGESLQYDWTAERHGVWMYHCGTAPVSSHIAAGMAGAVVIEPREGLAPVDHEYMMVQSEVYMGNEGRSPEDAVETNGEKTAAKAADFVVFNGIANQYMQEPLQVRVGETVRIFVSVVGPNNPTAFHVVGNQFDSVYFEGGYLIKEGRDAFGLEEGGSQSLGLQASQGGFVEMTFPEAGTYTMVNHIFSDAEAGAVGLIQVSE